MSLTGPICRCLVAFALLGSSVQAAEMADRAAEAEQLLGEGKPVQALAAIEAAFNSAWDKAPLGFSEALFVNAKPAGFGIYDVRGSAEFKPGEDMLVYAEPFGYGYGSAEDKFLIGFEADFELRTARGQILHSQENFAELAMTTRRRNKEFQVFITYNFQGLRAGDYVLVTRLRDQHSDKTGSFELPFTIAAVAPEPAASPAEPAPATD